jgi:predicted DNA binding protein
MHLCIPHLLTDITAAHRAGIPEEEPFQTMEEHFEEIDKWVSGGEPEHTFGYYCGLSSENFPPAEQLTDEEMKMIRKAFEQMMYSWNHGIDLPADN